MEIFVVSSGLESKMMSESSPKEGTSLDHEGPEGARAATSLEKSHALPRVWGLRVEGFRGLGF